MSMTRTTCPYCGVGCGLRVETAASGVRLGGDHEHPANYGKLCVKGSALGETLGLEHRLLQPQIGARPSDWNTALTAVATGLSEIIRVHGPDAVAFYVSGQLLTEDYYVANKLMKGFIGSANIDTNSRLCMASSVAGHHRAFGGDVVPGNYEDLEQADLVVLVGSNLAWCHPILYRRLQQTRRSARLVVIDPRRNASCEQADLHLALRSGSDTVLFNGLLVYLQQQGQLDQNFIAQHTRNFAAALQAARAMAPDSIAVAEQCGLSVEQVERFYHWFGTTERTVTVYSQGVNQSAHGVDNVNAILNCHLATARIGRPGMGPFSVTGQPNAMGGREVGALANQLAAHMDFAAENVERVARFWNTAAAAAKPGLKAVDLFRAVGDGRIKAVWIMATNPAVSLPEADAVAAALQRCELVIVSDVVADTDTARYANILLPALAWGEKDGTVTNSERRISRQTAFLPAPGQARQDWWIIGEVASRMGFAKQFAYRSPADIFREHAALSAFENQGRRAFDIGALASISDEQYRTLAPLQWPLPAGRQTGAERLFADGRFVTADGRARFIPIVRQGTAEASNEQYPLVLNTGRLRDQWHTMTRTGRAPRLCAHRPEPYAELHPATAAELGIAEDRLVRIASAWGEAIARARFDDGLARDSVFVPMHWARPFAGRSRIDAVVNPALDPISSQPEFKHTPVRVEPYRAQWQAFLLSRRQPDSGLLETCCYWASSRMQHAWRCEFAGFGEPQAWDDWARQLAQYTVCEVSEAIEYRDPAAGRYRFAGLHEGRLLYCLFVTPEHSLPPRDWLLDLFAENTLGSEQRRDLLRARSAAANGPPDSKICACNGVGRNAILAAIARGCSSTEALGAELNAGTNCGSCVPELRALLLAQADAECAA